MAQLEPALALILAAGEGRRLKPLTADRPKCLVPVGPSCFLERTLRALQPFPFDEICVVGGFFADQLRVFLPKFSLRGLHLCVNPHYHESNNAYSLSKGLTMHPDRSFLLLDGDLLFDPGLLEKVLEDPREDLLVIDGDPAKVTEEAMKVVVHDRSRTILKISKEIDPKQAHGEYIGMAKFSAGWAHLISQELQRASESGSYRTSYYEDVIQALLPQGPLLSVLETEGLRWSEIDTVEDLQRVSSHW